MAKNIQQLNGDKRALASNNHYISRLAELWNAHEVGSDGGIKFTYSSSDASETNPPKPVGEEKRIPVILSREGWDGTLSKNAINGIIQRHQAGERASGKTDNELTFMIRGSPIKSNNDEIPMPGSPRGKGSTLEPLASLASIPPAETGANPIEDLYDDEKVKLADYTLEERRLIRAKGRGIFECQHMTETFNECGRIVFQPCGKKVVPGTPYCRRHGKGLTMRIATQKPSPKEPDGKTIKLRQLTQARLQYINE